MHHPLISTEPYRPIIVQHMSTGRRLNRKDRRKRTHGKPTDYDKRHGLMTPKQQRESGLYGR